MKKIAALFAAAAAAAALLAACGQNGEETDMGYLRQSGMENLCVWKMGSALPDPLAREDGSVISAPEEWEARRAGLLELLSKYVYGPRPDFRLVRAEPGAESPDPAVSGNALTHFAKLYYDGTRFVSVRVTRPEKEGRYPVILRFEADDSHRFPIEAEYISGEKYVFVAVNHLSAAPEDGESAPEHMHEAKAIMAWACAASLAADYAQTLPYADPARLAVAGMSRTGKAAICAGVYDERFGVVIANSSGAGGASGFRSYGRSGAQGIDLAVHQPTWVSENLSFYRERPETLPLDMHYARALIAPRTLLSTESADGPDSDWACPYSAFRMWEAADPVFALYGRTDANLIHLRPGEHLQLLEDYGRMMQVVGHVFYGEGADLSLFRQNSLPAR